jgi:hypothetical protein
MFEVCYSLKCKIIIKLTTQSLSFIIFTPMLSNLHNARHFLILFPVIMPKFLPQLEVVSDLQYNSILFRLKLSVNGKKELITYQNLS